ncbi:MAG: hypothetical protein P4L28_09535 [Paludibacteraceae bacterium]|nr:hypothetical protein [Paludibacteraceae bacterium]
MRKLILSSIVILLLGISTANAQQNALGIRIGYGGEISFQTKFSGNRGEADLGWWQDGFTLTGIYQWVKPLGQGFDWYAGVGATLSSWDKGTGIGAVGNLGLEYNLQIPLQLSLDWRPAFYLTPETGFYGNSVGFSIRYKF